LISDFLFLLLNLNGASAPLSKNFSFHLRFRSRVHECRFLSNRFFLSSLFYSKTHFFSHGSLFHAVSFSTKSASAHFATPKPAPATLLPLSRRRTSRQHGHSYEPLRFLSRTFYAFSLLFHAPHALKSRAAYSRGCLRGFFRLTLFSIQPR